MPPRFHVDPSRVGDFCVKHGIAKLSLFGSAIRDDFQASSDVDVLVSFQPGRTPGLEFFSMQSELSEILGRPVDLHTSQSLSRYFREQVIAEAEDQYVAA